MSSSSGTYIWITSTRRLIYLVLPPVGKPSLTSQNFSIISKISKEEEVEALTTYQQLHRHLLLLCQPPLPTMQVEIVWMRIVPIKLRVLSSPPLQLDIGMSRRNTRRLAKSYQLLALLSTYSPPPLFSSSIQKPKIFVEDKELYSQLTLKHCRNLYANDESWQGYKCI